MYSTLDHRSLTPEFEPHDGHISRVFHLSLRFITVGGHSAHLAYHVHKSGHKTSSPVYNSSSYPFFNQTTLSVEHH